MVYGPDHRISLDGSEDASEFIVEEIGEACLFLRHHLVFASASDSARGVNLMFIESSGASRARRQRR